MENEVAINYENKIILVNKYNMPNLNDHVVEKFCITRGTPLGNPYTHNPITIYNGNWKTESREESNIKFKIWLDERLLNGNIEIREYLNRILKSIREGKTVFLICACAPKKCHGDYLRELLIEKLNSNEEEF